MYNVIIHNPGLFCPYRTPSETPPIDRHGEKPVGYFRGGPLVVTVSVLYALNLETGRFGRICISMVMVEFVKQM